MKKILFSLCIALNFMAMQVMAQSPSINYIPAIFPKSPNTAAMERYGNYEVNLFNGLPQIEIPIYTIESGDIKVPITLSYHASGLRIDDAASWVGAGWSLSGGGEVSRNVMGIADDRGFFSFKGIASLNPARYSGMDSLYWSVVDKTIDTRPDIYHYNLPGLSGRFFFNYTNSFKPVLIPYAPVSIKGTDGFDITDALGTKFSVGKTIKDVTSTYLTNGTYSFATTAWQLESIISQNCRDTVTFSYQQQTIGNPDITGQTLIYEDTETLFNAHATCGNYVNGPTTIIANSSATVTEHEVKSINFKNGRVDFVLSNVHRTDLGGSIYALDSIKVYAYDFSSRKLQIQKSVKFYKSYFAGLSGTFTKLKLDSIAISDKSGAVVQKYRFGYNQQPVLSSGSYSKDFWGYYNNKMPPGTTNMTLIPRLKIDRVSTGGSVDSVYIGADSFNTRQPDSAYMQAGVLDTIYYPTGGHTIFTYQTNRYYSGATMNLTGGLRVHSISSYDNINATPIVKTYEYNTAQPNFTSWTGTGGQLAYGFMNNTMTYRNWTNSNTDPHGLPLIQLCRTKRVRTYASQPGYELMSSDGSPVAYPKVTEYIGTPGSNTGKSVYEYRYITDDPQSASSTQIPIYYDYFFARGQLLTKSDYLVKPGNVYQVVKRTSNTYTAFPEKRYGGVGVAVGQIIVNEGAVGLIHPGDGYSPDDSGRFPTGSYGIVSDDNYLTGTSAITYDLADTTKFVSTSVAYNYGSDTTHQQIISKTHVDSKGNTATSTNKYAFNYPAGNTVIDSMVNRHMWADPIETSESYTIAGITKTTSAQLSQFKFGYIPYTIVADKVSLLNIISPVTDFTASSVSAGSLTKDSRYTQVISFDAYDTKNNVAQYTPRNATPTSILWDYLSEYPVAQVKNATYSPSVNTQEAYTSFESPQNGGWYYTGPTVTDPTAPTGNRVYNLNGGSVTSPSMDGTKSYVVSVWSNNGAPTVTAGSSLTGIPLRSTGGWTYYEYTVPAGNSTVTVSGTTSIDELRIYPTDAQMTTYAYATDGISDIADTKGTINHFDYDAFSRLKNTKDWAGNIVKNYGYHTYDQTHGNAAQGPATYTRDNCPSGTTPGSTTYSVPANKYFALTTADANAEAVYDMNVNGQIKANISCGCPIHYISFTLTNNSGNTGFQVTFSGIATPFNFPSSGSTVISVPEGTYATVSTALRSFGSTYTLGTRTPQTNVHSASFSNVVVATGSSDLSLTIN